MIKLSFGRITIQGFKSFRDKAIFPISRGPGLWFLEGRNEKAPRMGPNGAGKSTIWDALTWCLYGRTVKKLGNVDVRPWGTKTETRVRVNVKKDGVQHAITRTLGSKTILEIDGKEAGSDAPAELLGMSFELFTNTVLLGQGRPLFFDLDNAGKMKLFGDVLRLDRWDARAEAAKDGAAERKQKAHDLRTTAVTLKGMEEAALERLRVVKKRAAEEERDRNKTIRELEKQKAEGEKLYAQWDAKVGKADLAYDGSATEAKALERDYRTLQDTRFHMLQEQDAHKLKIAAAQKEVERITKAIARLEKTGKCPTCGQTIKGGTDKHKDGLLAELKEHKLLVKRGIPNGITSAIADLEDQVSKAYKALTLFQGTRDAREAEWNHAKEMRAAEGTKIAVLNEKLAAIEEGQMNEALMHARRQWHLHRKKAEETEKEATLWERRASRYQFWQKGFREIKLFELEDVLGELALNTSVILPEFGLEGWTIRYEVERTTQSGNLSRGLTVFVESPLSDRTVKWESWSGGEAQRLRLVGSLALSETLLQRAGVAINLEILDEPTQHLSTTGVSDVVEHLKDRANRRQHTIWLTDHTVLPSSQFTGSALVTHGTKGSSIT